MSRTFIGTITCLSLASAIGASPIQQSLKGEHINDFALWNLGNDSVYELFVTTLTGKAYCFDTAKLDEIWSAPFTAGALTSPIIGDFLGTGAPVLAFASTSGDLFFVWPGSGEIIATHKTSYNLSVAPSVAHFPTENKDYAVFPDDTGQVLVFGLSAEGAIQETVKIPNTPPPGSAFSLLGRTAFPAACDDLNHDGTPEIITVTNTGVIQVISLTQPPARCVTRLAQDTVPTTLIGTAALIPGENNAIALGVKASLYLFQWDTSASPSGTIRPLLETPAFGNSLGHILMAPINPDATPDVIATAENVLSARYYGKGLDNSPALLDIAPQHLTTINPPFSPACPVMLSNGSAGLFSMDSKGSVLLWQPTAPDIKPAEISTLPPTDRFTPGGNFNGGNKLSIVSWDPKSSTISVASTATDLKAHAIPALTSGINYSRNGNWSKDWEDRWNEQLARAATALEQAKASVAAQASDTASPLDAISILKGIAPADPAALKFSGHGKKSNLLIIAGGLITLIITVSIYLRFRKRKA